MYYENVIRVITFFVIPALITAFLFWYFWYWYPKSNIGTRIKFDLFLDLYKINPASWKIEDYCVTKRYKNGTNDMFGFSMIDFFKYRSFVNNIAKYNFNLNNANIQERLITEAQEEIKAERQRAQEEVDRAREIIERRGENGNSSKM